MPSEFQPPCTDCLGYTAERPIQCGITDSLAPVDVQDFAQHSGVCSIKGFFFLTGEGPRGAAVQEYGLSCPAEEIYLDLPGHIAGSHLVQLVE